MPSPFPGMDPFLERRWRDVHLSLIAFARGQLNRQLRPPLRAQAEERVFIESDLDDDRQSRHPDVYVVERSGSRFESAGQPTAALAQDVEPVVIQLHSDSIVERYLEIVDAESGGRVVTVIEFLSPTNKRKGTGRDEYLHKRDAYLRSDVNLVEVDLTRGGSRGSVLPVKRLPASRRAAAYLVCIRRVTRPNEIEAFPISLAARLPQIPIPLRPNDAEIQLDLQALIDLAYQEGQHDSLDYSSPLDPPLSPAEAELAERVLKEAGKR